MNRCEQTRIELANSLAEGSLHTPIELEQHLRCCANCRQAWQEMRLTWRALGGLHEQEVPPTLLRTTRAQVLGQLAREQANVESARIGKSALVSVAMGVVFSVALCGCLGGRATYQRFLRRCC
jgi:predicted anti-sigma-YlaC factor YlaD